LWARCKITSFLSLQDCGAVWKREKERNLVWAPISKSVVCIQCSQSWTHLIFSAQGWMELVFISLLIRKAKTTWEMLTMQRQQIRKWKSPFDLWLMKSHLWGVYRGKLWLNVGICTFSASFWTSDNILCSSLKLCFFSICQYIFITTCPDFYWLR
jgi:hypothetical protein